MIEAKHLFDGYDEEGFHNHRYHMHEIVCLLRAPPSAFLKRSPHTWRLFDDNGKLLLDRGSMWTLFISVIAIALTYRS
jgi:hypothetical protein